jgi:aerobic carbon-monoxide dehydrogenase small subunit
MILTVNGRAIDIAPGSEEKDLLDFLREDLDLTGTKRGCGIGACGSCTVLVDDKPVRACIKKVGDVAGKTVLTIEGLSAPEGPLHPLQQAFVDHGAIQCGFCTPGMVLSAHALLRRNPRPNREEIRRALAANLCRCTGYQQIVDAVEAASAVYPEKMSHVEAQSTQRNHE